MLAVASNLFGKSTSLSAYTLHTPAPSPSSSSSHLPGTAAPGSSGRHRKPFNVGLWRVMGASHKTTGKDVSVWVFEKKALEPIKGDRSGRSPAEAKEWVLEQLRKEATSLSRLRHPDILHMVEPLEDSRSELTFVTELITTSLGVLLAEAAGSGSSRRLTGPPGPSGGASGEVDLDEVEIQKGTLQIAKGLAFLHQQAKMVHLNLSPEAILVNAKGDWKLSGLNLTTPLHQPDGSATRYVYPEVDTRLPPQVQWKYDYLGASPVARCSSTADVCAAPEYALDSQLTPASDLYSLGCVLHAVHMGGKPPFQNRGSMQSLRDNAEGSLLRKEWARGSRWDRCSQELRGRFLAHLLPRLLTRQPSSRLSLASLPSHPFFSSLAISTLNFLDATTFASKPREEKATFLRGLVRVLPNFSDRLRKGKILPSLLEEMKDPYLLPFLLPNVFEISKTLSKEEFTTVLPKLQPLFALKDPPQNMLTLLEHLTLFEEKTIPAIFRENVMPLIYNSLDCEHLPVQEKALKTVPHLCEILDYGTVQNVLLVKVAILFTRTKILTVKVQTLQCFEAMVKTLDKVTLTTKLVPLLAKIKTKEPAVMMATLKVHEAMGAKVDREAIATLVLPQLWAMSMGPLLNADQFGHFMKVIQSLGSRVEAEHSQHLREVRRLESQTASYDTHAANGSPFDMNGMAGGGEVDFESLVKGQGLGMSAMPDPSSGSGAASAGLNPWDDGWADSGAGADSLVSSFPSLTVTSTSPPPSFPTSFPPSPAPPAAPSFPSSSSQTSYHQSPPSAGPSRLKARPVPSSSFNAAAFSSPPQATISSPPMSSSSGAFSMSPALTPSHPPTFAALQPAIRPQASARSFSGSGGGSSAAANANGPNYNLALSPQSPGQGGVQPSPMGYMASPPRAPPSYASTSVPAPQQPLQQRQPMATPPLAQPVRPAVAPPPGWSSGLMQPTKAPSAGLPNGALGKQNWDDFDPLK